LEEKLVTLVTTQIETNYLQTLTNILQNNLDFTEKVVSNPLHNFHSFPAKFPPDLPRFFINELTTEDNIVLDPMLGSGTTILEAYLEGRQAIGFDIDPLALLMAKVKISMPDLSILFYEGSRVIELAKNAIQTERGKLISTLENRWDDKTKEFIDYWFAPQTQLELIALLLEIERTADQTIKEFLQLTFSAIIITKSGGVSLALDLGHTRPHKVPVIEGPTIGHKGKRLRSAIIEFNKRFHSNYQAITLRSGLSNTRPQIQFGYAQDLPLGKETIDLIVTSPPYASTAIDYMRAHKFSLVWLGYPIHELAKKRGEYIGGDKIRDITESFPTFTASIITEVAQADERKGKILASYYSSMKSVLLEMLRVLKPGKAAILVVGNSVLKGKNTNTAECLAEIGCSLGFSSAGIGIRNINRDKRMMPVGKQVNLASLMQQRMHQEYVIGLYKPC
jgi:DNA modification methylase